MSDKPPLTDAERDALVRALMDVPQPTGLFALGEHLLADPETIRPFLQSPELAEQLQREIAAAVWELQSSRKPTVH